MIKQTAAAHAAPYIATALSSGAGWVYSAFEPILAHLVLLAVGGCIGGVIQALTSAEPNILNRVGRGLAGALAALVFGGMIATWLAETWGVEPGTPREIWLFMGTAAGLAWLGEEGVKKIVIARFRGKGGG